MRAPVRAGSCESPINTGVEQVLRRSTPDLHANTGISGDLPPSVAETGPRVACEVASA